MPFLLRNGIFKHLSLRYYDNMQILTEENGTNNQKYKREQKHENRNSINAMHKFEV